jgi:hypothetical protein
LWPHPSPSGNQKAGFNRVNPHCYIAGSILHPLLHTPMEKLWHILSASQIPRFSPFTWRHIDCAVSAKRNFCKAKDKQRAARNNRSGYESRQGDHMEYLILLAVVSAMVLYVLIVVGCLCYVGHHRRPTFYSK